MVPVMAGAIFSFVFNFGSFTTVLLATVFFGFMFLESRLCEVRSLKLSFLVSEDKDLTVGKWADAGTVRYSSRGVT